MHTVCRLQCVVPSMLMALLVSAVFGPARLQGADVLTAIPETALAIVIVNRLENTSDKIEKVAAKLQVPSASLLTLAKVRIGVHEGIDDKGTAAVAVMPAKDPGQMPAVLLFVPVTDYAKFLPALQPDDATKEIAEIHVLGQPMLAAKHSDYAVITNPEAQDSLEEVLGSAKDVSDSLAPLRTWLGEIEVGAVVLPSGIQLATQTGLQSIGQFKALMKQFGGQQPQQQQQQQQATAPLEMLEGLLRSIEAELTHVAVGVRVEDGGAVRLVSKARFAPGGEWLAAARGIKAPKENLLSPLPPGPFSLALGGVWPAAWREAFGGWAEKLMAANPAMGQLPPPQRAKLTKASVDLMAAVESIAMSLGSGNADDPLLAGSVGVLKVEDAKKYLALYEDSIKTINELAANPAAPAIAYEVKRIQIEGQEVLDVVMDLSRLNQGAAPQKAVFEKLYGPGDKLHTYLTVADPKTVVLAYVSSENLKRGLASAKGADENLTTDPQVVATATLLPAGSQWIGFVHPGSLLALVKVAMSQAPGAPKLQLPEIPPAPPIGLAAKISGGGYQGEMTLPGETIEAIGQAIGKARLGGD